MAIHIASPVRPSWKSGFARSAAESASPGLWDGLVGAWLPMLGVTGTTLHDVGPYRYDLERQGTLTTWGQNRFGAMLEFPATDNENYENTNDVDQGFSSNEVTLVCRATMAASGNFGLFDKASAGSITTNTGFLMFQEGSTMQFRARTTGLQTASDSGLSHPLTATWCGTYSATKGVAIYRDGVQKGSTAETAVFSNDVSGPICIGSIWSNLYWANADISAVLLYNRQLPPNLINALSDDPLAPFRRRLTIPAPLKGEPPTDFNATATLTASKATFASDATFTAPPPSTASATLLASKSTFTASASFVPAAANEATAALLATKSTFTAFADAFETFNASATCIATAATLAATATHTDPVYQAQSVLTASKATFSALASYDSGVASATSVLVASAAQFAATASSAEDTFLGFATLSASKATLAAAATYTPGSSGVAVLAASQALISATAMFTPPVFVPADEIVLQNGTISTAAARGTITTPRAPGTIQTY